MSHFTMRQLLEAGVHYGHHTRRWNPKMAPYIFGVRNGIHILDLEQTVPLLYRALQAVKTTVGSGGRVLFVGTKPQASDIIKESAKKCGQYYINHRWLGGMLTNWKTVIQSLKRMKGLEEVRDGGYVGLTKKEILDLDRKHAKLESAIGGIRDMGGLPDLIFVVDTNKESLAIQEANRLGIPVVAILDSNSNPDGVSFPVPGNDDAIRSIQLYCDLVADSAIDGLQAEMISAGIDIGAAADLAPTLDEEESSEEQGESEPVSA